MQRRWRRIIHWLFDVGVWIKGLDGFFETAAGAVFLIISRSELMGLVHWATRGELAEDPDDRIANWILHTFQHLPHWGKLFGAVYLIGHGLIKALLAVFLLRGKMWAYPIAMAALGAFIIYQLVLLGERRSLGLIALTIVDLIVLGLIGIECSLRRTRAGRVIAPSISERPSV